MTTESAATEALRAEFRRSYFEPMAASYRAEGLGYVPDEDTEFALWLESEGA